MATRWYLVTESGRKAHEDHSCVHIDNPDLTRISEEERQRKGISKCTNCSDAHLPMP